MSKRRICAQHICRRTRDTAHSKAKRSLSLCLSLTSRPTQMAHKEWMFICFDFYLYVCFVAACLPACHRHTEIYVLFDGLALAFRSSHTFTCAHSAHTHTHSHCPLTTNALWCERVRQYTLRSGLVPIRRRQNDDSAAYASSERISLCWFAMAHFEVRMNGIVSLQVICIASARKVATT